MRGNTVAKMLSVSGRLNINMTTTVLFVMMSCKVCETISMRYCCFLFYFLESQLPWKWPLVFWIQLLLLMMFILPSDKPSLHLGCGVSKPNHTFVFKD